MPARIVDDLKTAVLFTSARLTSTSTTLYNGMASGSANGLDTQEYDELMVAINFGDLSLGTYDFALVESDTNDSSTAAVVTGANFTQVSSAADQTLQNGYARVAGTKRYVWLRSVSSATAGNADFSALAILGKPRKAPVTNSQKFNV